MSTSAGFPDSLVTITPSQLRLGDRRVITTGAGEVNVRLLASAALATWATRRIAALVKKAVS